MDHDRHVQILHQLPKRPSFVVIGIAAFVARVDEYPLESQLTNCTFGFLDERGAATRKYGGERVEDALVIVLQARCVVVPLLHCGEFFAGLFAAKIMRGVGDDAHIHACCIMSLEEIFENHWAAAVSPTRPVIAVPCSLVVSCFFGRIDMCVPVDDHYQASP